MDLKVPIGIVGTCGIAVMTAIMMLSYPEQEALYLTRALILMGVLFIGLRSIYLIKADEMIASFLLGGSHWATYITSDFAEQEDWNGVKMIAYPKTQRGLLGLDVVIVLWPIWIGYRVPTTAIVNKVHAQRVYTKANKEASPEVPVRITTTMVYFLTPDLGKFVRAFGILGHGTNLTRSCKVRDNLWDPEKPEHHQQEGTFLAQIVQEAGEDTILEAVRMKGNAFPWEGTNNIKGSLEAYEKTVLEWLGRPESIFAQGGLLANDKSGNPGSSARSVDFNIVHVDVEDEEVQKALGEPLIAAKRADARERQGDGDRRRIEKLKEAGLTAREVLQADTLKEVETFNVMSAGEEVVDVASRLLGMRKKPSGKSSPKKP